MLLSIVLLLGCSDGEKDPAEEADADTDADTDTDTDSDTDADTDSDADTDTDTDSDTDTDTDTDDTGTKVPLPDSAFLILPCQPGHGHASGNFLIETPGGTKVAELSWKEDEGRMLGAALEPGDYQVTWSIHAWDTGWESDFGSKKQPFTVTDTSYYFLDDSTCGDLVFDVLEAGVHYEPAEVLVSCDVGLTPLYCESIVEYEDVTVGPLLTKDPATYAVTWTDGYTAPGHAVDLLTNVEHVHFARPNPK